MGFWKKIMEIECNFHYYIISRALINTVLTLDIELNHLPEADLVRFPHSKVTVFSPFPYDTLRRKSHCTPPGLKVGNVTASSWEWNISMVFGILLHGSCYFHIYLNHYGLIQISSEVLYTYIWFTSVLCSLTELKLPLHFYLLPTEKDIDPERPVF